MKSFKNNHSDGDEYSGQTSGFVKLRQEFKGKKEWTTDGPLKIDLDPLKPRFQTFQGSMDPIHMEPGANPGPIDTASQRNLYA